MKKIFWAVLAVAVMTFGFIFHSHMKKKNRIVTESPEKYRHRFYKYIDRKYDNIDCLSIGLLSHDERLIYSALRFEDEMLNGGLCQYFANAAETAPYICEALTEIGAYEICGALSGFIAKNCIDTEKLDEFSSANVEEYIKLSKEYAFDEFNNDFSDVYFSGREDILELAVKWSRKNNVIEKKEKNKNG